MRDVSTNVPNAPDAYPRGIRVNDASTRSEKRRSEGSFHAEHMWGTNITESTDGGHAHRGLGICQHLSRLLPLLLQLRGERYL